MFIAIFAVIAFFDARVKVLFSEMDMSIATEIGRCQF